MGALSFAVGSLRKQDVLIPALESPAVTHVDYGVECQHYDTVGKALIETLSLHFGERFTLEVRTVWTETYQLVASIMKRAAYE
jgi:hemoglobin-like flavoprotein